jgi:hypothetical protein
MIDVVIPLGTGSDWQDNELRYSLRSFERYLTGVNNVYLIGEKPDWIQNVIHVPFPDIDPVPCHNTTAKILFACRLPEVTENFLLSNDDFFLTRLFDANSFPYYWRSDLLSFIHKLKPKSVYRSCRVKTAEVLKSMQLATKSFEVHCPFRINKTKFLKMSDLVQLNHCLPRSVYGNLYNLQATPARDIIVNLPLNLPVPLNKMERFSIRAGEVNPYMINFFSNLYPKKSQWELQ